MSLVKPETPLCAVIDNDPSVIPVLNRFGISLGTGDTTVEQICRINNLNAEFVLAIVNTFVNESYFPENMFRAFGSCDIADYLEKTNEYYSRFQLANIERHFRLLLPTASADSNIHLLLNFFQELSKAIFARIKADKEIVFPALNGKVDDIILNGFISSMDETDKSIADRLTDLKNMFVKHLRGECDNNLLYAVLVAIITLEKDIRQNNRIRARLLRPLLKATLSTDNNK